MRKMNLVQALGSLISLILYIVAPVISLSLVLVSYGISGQICMQLDTLFVIPVILMAVTLVLSLLPLGKGSSIMGVVTALAMLVIGLISRDTVSGKLNLLLDLAGMDISFSSEMITAAAGLLIQMGWGLIAGVVIMLISSVAGVLITGADVSGIPMGSSRSSVNRNDQYTPRHSGNNRGNIYRK